MNLKLGATLAVLCLPLSAFAAEPVPIGQIKVLSGPVTVSQAGAARAGKAGETVFLNDDVETGGDGSVGITLNDGTTLSLGPGSRMVLDDFVYDPGRDQAGMTVGVLKGTMAYVSGRIASLAPEKVSVRTPMATIGIRGTRFVVKAGEE
jgi:hypothetical protein